MVEVLTRSLKAHYDGKFLVPDEPVDLPVGGALEIQITELAPKNSQAFPLLELATIGQRYPSDLDMLTDAAANIEHYLYGAPKQI